MQCNVKNQFDIVEAALKLLLDLSIKSALSTQALVELW